MCLNVPFSNKRYKVSESGEVLDANNKPVQIETIDGKPHVELMWYDGLRKYEVGVVVVITHEVVPADETIWNALTTKPIDGDELNTSVDNLTYYFKGGRLESPVSGFYHIPYATNYAMNDKLDVLSLNTNKLLSPYKSKPNDARNAVGGYLSVRMIHDDGKSRSSLLHRLVGLVYLDYPADYRLLVVNHLDGNPGNCLPYNLEWCTGRDNALHALKVGLRTKIRKVESLNLITGEVRVYQSAAHCGGEAGYSSGDPITNRIGKSKLYSDYMVYRYQGDNWPEVPVDAVDEMRCGVDTDYVGINVFENKMVHFTSAAAGERLTGVHRVTILLSSKNKSRIPTRGWIFRFKYPSYEIPEYTDDELLILKHNRATTGFGVEYLDDDGNRVRFFPSVGKMKDELGLTIYQTRYLIEKGVSHCGNYRIEKKTVS